jgi:translation initiation factor 5A
MASAGDVERGKFIEYKGDILQVVRKEVIAVGTHSHTKIKFTVVGLNSTGEKSLVMGHEDKVEILDIMKKVATVISKSQKGIQIMDVVSYETFDAEGDKHLLDELKEGEEIIYIGMGGGARIISRKAQH